MYDTVHLRLAIDEAGDVDFVGQTTAYISKPAEHYYDDGGEGITGSLGNFRVYIRPTSISLKGSLCKWYLGDNFQTLNRETTKQAIEALSSVLHLPMERADVTRIDFANNLILEYPVEVYLNHMGEMSRSKRAKYPSSIYYRYGGGQMAFYDKEREQRDKKESIPSQYKGLHILRIEQRYESRLQKTFNQSVIKAATLYDEAFYSLLQKSWYDKYQLVDKINDIIPDFDMMKGKKEMDILGRAALIERYGGLENFLAIIDGRYKMGKISRRNRDSLVKATKDAYLTHREGISVTSEAIKELDAKVLAVLPLDVLDDD